MTEPTRTDLLSSAADLTTVSTWIAAQEDGIIPPGGMIAVAITGVAGVQQTFGAESGTQVLSTIITRMQEALPADIALLRCEGNIYLVWLPGLHGFVLQAVVSHLRLAVSGTPILLPGGEQVTAKLIFATQDFTSPTPAPVVVQAAQHALTRQPEFQALPAKMTRVVSAADELARRLGAVRLYGMDGMVERILAHLALPALTPKTAFIAGPARAGKTRLLTSLERLLAGQHLPLATITCATEAQATAGGVLHAIIHQFLAAHPPDALHRRLTPTLAQYPWLATPFPALRTGEVDPPAAPRDADTLVDGYQAVLRELTRAIPHVVLLRHAQWMDPASRQALATLQQAHDLGLRLVATVDDAGEPDGTALVDAFADTRPLVLPIPALRHEQVLALLAEVTPDIARPAIATALLEASDGLPIAVEEILQAWAENGMLSYCEGHWFFFPERCTPAAPAPASSASDDLYAVAALASPVSRQLLSVLWEQSEDDTRVLVERGRAKGIFAPPDPDAPDLVQVSSADAVVRVTRHLTAEDRQRLHRRIATMMEEHGGAEIPEQLTQLVHHFTAAGDRDRSRRYTSLLRERAASPETPAPVIVGMDEWDIPPTEPLESEQLDLVSDTVISLRLAGVQFRLYPPSSPIVRTHVRAAFRSLERLLSARGSLIFTFDGGVVSVDGQVLTRRDLVVALKDFQVWMQAGRLRAIGIARGVREDDLTRFLDALVTYDERRDTTSSLLREVRALNLRHIRVLEMQLLPEAASSSIESPTGEAPGTTGGARDDAAPDAFPDTVPTLADPTAVSAEAWEALPAQMDTLPTTARRLMMANLARWMSEQSGEPAHEVSAGLDALLLRQLVEERDAHAYFDLTVAVERRVETLMRRQEWPTLHAYIAAIQQCLAKVDDEEIGRVARMLVGRLGESQMLRELIDRALANEEELAEARTLMSLLGEYALAPLIEALKNTAAMDERMRLMQLLREFGGNQQPLLLQELRRQNPWYVYRNVLQILAEIGDEEALAVISEKIRFADPRVRAEAMTAAARIARARAGPYVAIGLEDEHADVRARAALAAGQCMNNRVLMQLERRLQDIDEADSVLANTCVALGAAREEHARDLLLKVANAGVFSPYRRKSHELRMAALRGLENYLDHPGAQAALQAALKSSHPQVRATAKQVLRQRNAPAS